MFTKLSIIIPVYNEERTIQEILKRVIDAPLTLKKEIIVVDDGSTDNSKKLVTEFKKKTGANIILIKKKNGGKGSAVKVGISRSTGQICIIQDADLEYDPNDYSALLKPIIDLKTQVVYGSRFLKSKSKNEKSSGFVGAQHPKGSMIYYMGNMFLSFLTRVLYGSRITDVETCYKVFKTDVIRELSLNARKFDFEPEITAKLLRKSHKILEVPIAYNPRSVEEGKKIGWKDGVQAIYCLIKYRFTK